MKMEKVVYFFHISFFADLNIIQIKCIFLKFIIVFKNLSDKNLNIVLQIRHMGIRKLHMMI